MRWAVGLITAPRKLPTLHTCLASIQEAGWPSIQIFAEPGISQDQLNGNLITTREQTLGAFPNWYLGLTELYLRNPRAHAYLMFQDDALVAESTRSYLEKTLWPAPEIGVVSLYCPSHEHVSRSTGYKLINPGWNAWGAVAYVFSNPGLRRFLSDRVVLNHPHHGPANGQRNIDSVVGSWCQRESLPYFLHVPSLVQHIGETSTIWTRGKAVGKRRAVGFDSCFPLKNAAEPDAE